MKSLDIGTCVYVLFHKLWGKIIVDGQLRSEKWWRFQLDKIINAPEKVIQPEYLFDGKPAEPATPLEIEMGYPQLTYEELLRAWKKLPNQPECGD